MQSADDENVYQSDDSDLSSNEITKKRLRKYYDLFYENSEFEYYDEVTTRKFLKALMKKAGVSPPMSILDVGCATGFYTEQLRKIGLGAVGIDLSPVGVSKGHEKYPEVSLAAGDAAAMPFKPKTFNAIFMFGCSLTNTRDLNAIKAYHTYLTEYLRLGGVVISIGGSDFSGRKAATSEWIYHSYGEILRFVDRDEVVAEGPFITNFKLLSVVGRIGLSRFLSDVFRRLHVKRRWAVVYFIRKKKV